MPQGYWMNQQPVNIITTGTARERESQEGVFLDEDVQELWKTGISGVTITYRLYSEWLVHFLAESSWCHASA